MSRNTSSIKCLLNFNNYVDQGSSITRFFAQKFRRNIKHCFISWLAYLSNQISNTSSNILYIWAACAYTIYIYIYICSLFVRLPVEEKKKLRWLHMLTLRRTSGKIVTNPVTRDLKCKKVPRGFHNLNFTNLCIRGSDTKKRANMAQVHEKLCVLLW